ncbi:MAG: hypothetical protein NG740_03090 [Omnitrophica bacterium]|nr:hypothetical protein [Candidatus Omnitrophota bacterium]
MLKHLFIVPGENGLLEAAVEAAEVNVKQHGDSADFPGLAEIEEVVLEELIAAHSLVPLFEIASGRFAALAMTVFWIPAFAGMTGGSIAT